MKLLVRDVHGLGTIDGIDDSHVFHDKAIQRVEVAGVVVHIKFGATKSFGGYGAQYEVDSLRRELLFRFAIRCNAPVGL